MILTDITLRDRISYSKISYSEYQFTELLIIIVCIIEVEFD